MIERTFPMASATGNAKLVQVAVHIVTDRTGDTIINLVDAEVALVTEHRFCRVASQAPGIDLSIATVVVNHETLQTIGVTTLPPREVLLVALAFTSITPPIR
jgi:subtilisin-like proprotein convertase family protein